jgi:hypothetical protein
MRNFTTAFVMLALSGLVLAVEPATSMRKAAANEVHTGHMKCELGNSVTVTPGAPVVSTVAVAVTCQPLGGAHGPVPLPMPFGAGAASSSSITGLTKEAVLTPKACATAFE